MVSDEFKGAELGSMEAVPAGVSYKWASQEMAHAPDLSMASMAAGRAMSNGDITMLQEQVLLRV
jgi:hypothetical protein